MNLDTVELINEIMIRPEIWMSKHPANKNKWKTLRKWEEMKANKFPLYTVDDLKKRWKNIKDQYRKELKKLPQSRPGVLLENITSNWRYFDYLAFMRDELVVFKDTESENVEMDQEGGEGSQLGMENAPKNAVSKRPQLPFTLAEKTDICNMYDELKKTKPSASCNEISRIVAPRFGVHWVSVHRLVKEKKCSGTLRSPKKKKHRISTVDKTDEATKRALSEIIEQFSKRSQEPTLDNILVAVNKDGTLGQFKRSTFHKLLKSMGHFGNYNKSRKSYRVSTDRNDEIDAPQEYSMIEMSEIKNEEVPSPQHSDPKSDDEDPTGPQISSIPVNKPRISQPPKEMREELLKIEQRKLQILEAEVARSSAFMKSDNYQFLMSLLPEMEKLPPVHKMRLRMKISQAVLDEVTSFEQGKYNNIQLTHIQDTGLDPINIEIKEEPINMYD